MALKSLHSKTGTRDPAAFNEKDSLVHMPSTSDILPSTAKDNSAELQGKPQEGF